MCVLISVLITSKIQFSKKNCREEGLGGFAKGLAPRMLRRSVMAALAWTVYEKITTSLKLK